MPLIIKKDNIEKKIEYIPFAYKGDEEPFTVTLKRIKIIDYSKLEDSLTKFNQEEQTVSVATGSFNYNACRRGIVSWKNIKDENNVDVKIQFNANGLVSEESMELLPTYLIDEIGTVISNITKNPDNIYLYDINSIK